MGIEKDKKLLIHLENLEAELTLIKSTTEEQQS